MIRIFDGHGDIWNDVVKKRGNGEKNIIKRCHLDKFKTGTVFSGIFVVWVDTPVDNHPDKRFNSIVNAMKDELEENNDILLPVKQFEDFDRAANEGKFPIVLGIEGLDGLLGDGGKLEELYDLGFRHASLTWNTENPFATGVKGHPEHGLSALGVEAIRSMESKGMLLDVSHLNDKSFWDVVKIAKKPFIASHSNARKLCDVPRNLTDAQIQAIKNSGGLIGVNAYREFIHSDENKQDLSHFVDHIEHIVNIAGIDHVGLGFDFVDYLDEDAMGTFSSGALEYTKDLENATKAVGIAFELQKRGYTVEEIEKVCALNFLRVLKETLK